MFPGHLRCECGRRLTGQRKKGKYTYYTHTCAHSGKKEALREELVSRLLEDEIREFRFSPSFAENLKALFRHVGEIRRRNINSEREEINRNISSIEEKQSLLYDLYMDRGIDRERLKKKCDGLDQEIARLEASRRSFALDYNELMDRACDLIDALHDRPAAFLAAESLEQKTGILKGLAEEVTVSREIARISWKPPFSYLLKPTFLDLKEQFGRNAANHTLDRSVQGWGGKPENLAIPGMKKAAERPQNGSERRFSGLKVLPR